MSSRTRSAELAALTAIAAEVNRTQDLKEILTAALRMTLGVMGESAGEIFLLDKESGDLILYVHQGLSDSFLDSEAVVGFDECLCGLALRSKGLSVIEDLATHPARSRLACVREGFAACVHLPLLARGEVLGLLNIQSRGVPPLTAEDEELLVAIGHQIGIAIANARLIEEAERRRAMLDSVMCSLVDGLILLDRRGRIIFVNPRAEQMLDLPADTLLGQRAGELDGLLAGRVAQPQEVMSRLQAAAEDLEATPAVEVLLTVPGPRTVEVRLFPILGAGEGRLGLGLLLRDISREKELDEIKSQLLATVSHELRTPLASIKGFATTLLREDVEWDEASRHEFLSIIDQESDRLSELIGNLLDMSRIEAGTLRVEPELADLGALLQETAAEFQVMTHAHRFEARVPEALPPVWADPRRTRQVLRNLVENAVKYSPDGGSVCLEVGVQADQAVVSVADEGLGIDARHQERIFERFYQADSASTRQVGGSGLGLAISKAIVEAQGGRIWVESEVGIGSTFYFTLPLAQGRGRSFEEGGERG